MPKTIRANYSENDINEILGSHLILTKHGDFVGKAEVSLQIQFKGNPEDGTATINRIRVEATLDDQDIHQP